MHVVWRAPALRSTESSTVTRRAEPLRVCAEAIDGPLLPINAPLMIPMHFLGRVNLDRFLSSAGAHFAVEHSSTASIRISRETLNLTGSRVAGWSEPCSS
jgi:hypothetical protein